MKILKQGRNRNRGLLDSSSKQAPSINWLKFRKATNSTQLGSVLNRRNFISGKTGVFILKRYGTCFFPTKITNTRTVRFVICQHLYIRWLSTSHGTTLYFGEWAVTPAPCRLLFISCSQKSSRCIITCERKTNGKCMRSIRQYLNES